jgi:hypothetical protein
MQSKYKSLVEWRREDPRAYLSAKKHGLIEKICEAFGWNIELAPYSSFSKEQCIEEAKKYLSRKEWRTKDFKSYHAATTKRWNEECCKHMMLLKKPADHWKVKQNCIDEARKYNTISEWNKNSTGSHRASTSNGWYDECISHMRIKTKLSKEECKNEALNCKSVREWRKTYPHGYYAAKKNGWYNECTSHMKKCVVR